MTLVQEEAADLIVQEHPRSAQLRRLIASKNEALLGHRYFKMCRGKEVGREALIGVVKQLYCFSIFFERLLTRRISDFSTGKDRRVLDIARGHLREEIGHTELFADCLRQSGVPEKEITELAPKMFTKALFGYLMATVQYENEYVTHVAIMQVMESIGFHFFSETARVMQAYELPGEVMFEHWEADQNHPELGLELVAGFDHETMAHCLRIIDDVYRLMGFVLDEWLGIEPTSGTPARRRRSSRPPRAN